MSQTHSERTSRGSKRRLLPIVFLGPSLAYAHAKRILDADYRPPVQRGDLDTLTRGSVVAIIDGVFDHNIAISPREIRDAVARGVRVFGSSSMGALRANEVPGVIGVGRVFDMFRRGEVENDDEVAVAFDPESKRSLSEPLVNIRHAVDRLVRPGSLSPDIGKRIVNAARRLHYPDRVYPRIIKEAGLAGQLDAQQLISMLSSHDLKRDDAITLLEYLRQIEPDNNNRQVPQPPPQVETAYATAAVLPANAPVHFWEYGPPLPFADVVLFLKLTGEYPRYARAAVSRFLLEGNELEVKSGTPKPEVLHAALYHRLRFSWDWLTEEEVAISLSDLGIGTETLEEHLDQEVEAERRLMALTREGSDELLRALRVELFLNDLALKREAIRCASLGVLAEHGRSHGKLLASEIARATATLCARLYVGDLDSASETLACWGVSTKEMNGFIEQLAFAQRVAGKMTKRGRVTSPKRRRGLCSSPKVSGDRRFCLPFPKALVAAKRLTEVIGVTRIAVITGLGDIGIPNAQAFRPDGSWSSTVGSGKSESVLGAKIGAVMEEVEKWAQEKFGSDRDSEVLASYDELLRSKRRSIDPKTLDLPYDSCYRPDVQIQWRECVDLIGPSPVLVPTSMMVMERGQNDISYSPRGGRRTLDTNGLASGFTLEEALTHAISEYIERHSTTLHNILEVNPGVRDAIPALAIDVDTVPGSTRRLLKKISRAGHRVQIKDITSHIGVPTFMATILTARSEGGWVQNPGYATHPDPEVAINMALLEATQTIMTATAGAREDITLRARSLGRHERTRARSWSSWIALQQPNPAAKSFGAVSGFVSHDARDDVHWLRDRLCAAGSEHLLFVELTRPEIRPARVVRVLIPGLETINPFRTGPEARRALLRDLM